MKPMPAPYSHELRQKALAAVKRGERKIAVSQMFHISRKTLDVGLKRQAQTGDCGAITQYQQGCRHKITDWQRLRAGNRMAARHKGNWRRYGVTT